MYQLHFSGHEAEVDQESDLVPYHPDEVAREAEPAAEVEADKHLNKSNTSYFNKNTLNDAITTFLVCYIMINI